MNVYDKAYDLAKALNECAEAKGLQAARQAVDSDPQAKRMLDDFRERQNEFQQHMMAGEEPPETDMEQLNKQYEVLSMHPLIHTYFEAERRFAVVFEDVNRIMTDMLKTVLDA